MPNSLTFSLVPVFAITSITWAIGVSNHRFLLNEIGIYLLLFFLPALVVCGSVWMIFQPVLWRRMVGVIIALPAVALWVLSLLLVFNGFKIH
ncbi:MAG: hypothetical protein OQL20_00095 [Sedimenticola sp.]|nr:hypothetical protein [Sedimenticola sp.]